METDLISVVGVFGGSALLGLMKKYTSLLDHRIGKAIKPLQPTLVAVAGIGLPYLTSALGISSVDPSVFVTAPTATVAAVSLREVALRLRGKK